MTTIVKKNDSEARESWFVNYMGSFFFEELVHNVKYRRTTVPPPYISSFLIVQDRSVLIRRQS